MALIITAFVWLYRSLTITNIYVTGNNLLTENTLIKEAGIEDYPKIYQVSKKEIEKKLLLNPLINKVTVKISFLGKVIINIEENIPLYYDSSNKVVLSNGETMEDFYAQVPHLINTPEEIYQDKLTKKMVLIDKNILLRISEIEYKPTDLDKERFLMYMQDGNYVYITLNKINLINTYNEIYPTLEGKKGILYLDSGNHFEIKKE